MAKPGRPKWIPSAEDTKRAENFAKAGLTEEQIAHALGISQDTLISRKKEYIEFNEAIKRGKALGIAIVASELMKLCQDGNATAQIFYLKTRAGWSETVKHTGTDGQSIKHDVKISATSECWNNRMDELIGDRNE